MIVPPFEIDEAVSTRFPDYAALVIVGRGLRAPTVHPIAQAALRDAIFTAQSWFGRDELSTHPHIRAWREAFHAFGAKPSKYPSSVEALLKRAVGGDGVPSINALVDAYNAVSIDRVLPVGGEDLGATVGPITLCLAQERHVTQARAEGLEPPKLGEVVWADDAGVTCRRWCWRQGVRTRLTDTTDRGYFLLERLAPYDLAALEAAGQQLSALISQITPNAELTVLRRGPGWHT